MSSQIPKLIELLPLVHQVRDAEQAEQLGLDSGPLTELLGLIEQQIALVEENIAQSYDDLFIETCQDWATAYIGDLIGYQSLHGKVPDVASPRAEVAHTIALRRRKGTAVVLEQLARDVTGWDARAVEFFQLLCASQYMNHIRLHAETTVDMRDLLALERIDSAFDSRCHTVDVRRIASGRGKHNIPNVGIFLWRLQAYSHTQVPAQELAAQRFIISPLGIDIALFSRPFIETQQGILLRLSLPQQVPEPLSRRWLDAHLSDYYGLRQTAGDPIDNSEPSILLEADGVEIPRDQVCICDLSNDGADWAHPAPDGKYAIDPALGRVASPPDQPAPAELLVSYHQGFSADMGGGEYERLASFAGAPMADARVPDDFPSIQAALNALGGAGVVEITDNASYSEALSVQVIADASIELRAANGRHPHIQLTAPMTLSGGAQSRVYLNGLLISGDGLRVEDVAGNELTQLNIRHCTLVPGISLNADGSPADPNGISLAVELGELELRLQRSICGAIRVNVESETQLVDSILDATDLEQVLLADTDDDSPAGLLSARESTLIGKIRVREVGLISNTILLARLSPADPWNAPVWTQRKQTGCVRFSYLPFDSIVPRRFRCQPDSEASALSLVPVFNALQYGQPAYGQLARRTSPLIWRGAEDESEMGAFHHLYAPQRDANLRIRLDEYLRVGLEAGLFYAS